MLVHVVASDLPRDFWRNFVSALETQVYSLEMTRALKKPSDITAWEAMARAMSAYRRLDAAALQSGIEEAKRAVAIAQDCALVLCYVGTALCLVGYPEEGVHHTVRAVRKGPGSGLLHYFHGVACVMLNRPEDALSHLNTAARLSPSWHLMWAVKSWQGAAYRELGRWTAADAAVDESNNLNQTDASNYVLKVLLCVQPGRDAEARIHIETARRLGYETALAELFCRRS